MKDKVIAYEELVPGYEFPYTSYELNAPLVAKYLKAVTSSADGFVPPLAITAHAMAAMAGALSLPDGSIHASQELEFFKLVPIGATIECRAKVAQKLTRGKVRLLVLELSVFDQNGQKVQSGKTTVVLPA